MAERRMINRDLIDSDVFLDMPQTTQNLYFHLIVRADDDGFLDSPKKIMRSVGNTQNDLEILLSKQFLIGFDSGVIVVRHWKIHNLIRRDRYKPTLYQEEISQLSEDVHGVYHLTPCNQLSPVGETSGVPSDNQVTTNGQPSDTGQNESMAHREGKYREGYKRKNIKKENFPKLSEIEDYCTQRNFGIVPSVFFDYYESIGWMVGDKPMVDWKAAVRNWERRTKDNEPKKGKSATAPAPDHIGPLEEVDENIIEDFRKAGGLRS